MILFCDRLIVQTYTLLAVIFIGCCLCDVIRLAASADDDSSSSSSRSIDDQPTDSSASASSSENDEESGNDPFRTKRQHGGAVANPLSGILSSVFNKKLGLIGSLSSISSSSKGGGSVETHHHTYEYSVSVMNDYLLSWNKLSHCIL